MSPDRNPLSVSRLLLILFGCTFLGVVVGTISAFRQTPVYQAWARIDSADHAGHQSAITPLRAKFVTRDMDLANRWAMPFDQAAGIIASSVELKSDAGGVWVTVTHPDPRDAWMLAREVARGLVNPEREASLEAKYPDFRDFTEEESTARLTILQLEELLDDQAEAGGFADGFSVVRLASEGNAEAKALQDSEEFQRRWVMMEQLSRKLGYHQPPGEPILPPANHVEEGRIPEMPLEDSSKFRQQVGRASGMAVGLLIVIGLLQWKPEFLRPVSPAPLADASASNGATASDDPW